MKNIVAYLLLLTFFTFTFGQNRSDKPNLSGTWRLAESKGVAKLNNQTENFVKTMVIIHQEPEIKMTIQIKDNGYEKSPEENFFSDGRGEINSTFGENKVLKSKTKWSGNKLEVRRIDTISIHNPAGYTKVIKLEINEKWELSKDGNTLTKTTSVSGPPGSRLINSMGGGPSKEIFSRDVSDIRSFGLVTHMFQTEEITNLVEQLRLITSGSI